ncbi:MFS transporter [Streptomyces flaveolus]|uniref:MFS transporter n=1 Tax=Streptomyces flaveolus TaxID=67297 RepID=UPI0036F508A6
MAQVANALPASLNGLFQQDLNTHGSQLTWITAAFMIAVVCFEFTFGVLGDLFGRRRLVLAGTALVAAGSTVAALAPTVQVLWLGAALNGLGAGAMFPGSLTALTAVTRGVRQRAHAVAVWSGFLSVGAAVSPLLGGMFARIGTWRGSFWVLVGLALISMVLTMALATESNAPEGRHGKRHHQHAAQPRVRPRSGRRRRGRPQRRGLGVRDEPLRHRPAGRRDRGSTGDRRGRRPHRREQPAAGRSVCAAALTAFGMIGLPTDDPVGDGVPSHVPPGHSGRTKVPRQ